MNDKVENKEVIEQENPEETTETETVGEVENDGGAGETEETSEDTSEETGEEEVTPAEPDGKFYTEGELDAMAAGARKQGISQGKKELMEEFNSSIPNEIYDPRTGQQMLPDDPMYASVQQKIVEDATLKYNKQLQMKMANEAEKKIAKGAHLKTVVDSFQKQKQEMTASDEGELVQSLTDKIVRDWDDEQYNPMIEVASTTQNGVKIMASIWKSEPKTLERISNLAPTQQAAEMTRLIERKGRGKGKAITKSKAPAPASSYATGGSSSVKKSAANMTLEDKKAEFRAKHKMLN